jgi:hypothetical protein
MTKLFITLALIALLSSCAHHKDVRAGVNGVHTVKVVVEEKSAGSRNALMQANHFCEQRQLSAAVISEEAKYTGDMDEKTYKTVKTASRAAEIIGGSTYALSKKKSKKNIGSVLGVGAAVADATAGKGYTIIMKFKCL